MVYGVKREELTEQQWQEMREIAANNVCGICGAELQIHTNPEKATLEVGCLNREHHGYIERTTYTQNSGVVPRSTQQFATISSAG